MVFFLTTEYLTSVTGEQVDSNYDWEFLTLWWYVFLLRPLKDCNEK